MFLAPSAPTREQIRPPSLADRLKAAQTPPAAPVTPTPAETPSPGNVDDAEVITGPVFDPSEVTPIDPEFDEGVAAFKAGHDETANPYSDNPRFSSWLCGYRSAKEALR